MHFLRNCFRDGKLFNVLKFLLAIFDTGIRSAIRYVLNERYFTLLDFDDKCDGLIFEFILFRPYFLWERETTSYEKTCIL